jgi:hypothetical protein
VVWDFSLFFFPVFSAFGLSSGFTLETSLAFSVEAIGLFVVVFFDGSFVSFFGFFTDCVLLVEGLLSLAPAGLWALSWVFCYRAVERECGGHRLVGFVIARILVQLRIDKLIYCWLWLVDSGVVVVVVVVRASCWPVQVRWRLRHIGRFQTDINCLGRRFELLETLVDCVVQFVAIWRH